MKKTYFSIKAFVALFALTAGTMQAQSYCSSGATSAADEEIFNVTISTLNNTSNCGTTGGPGSSLNLYSNYTNVTPALPVPVLVLGQNYPLSVTVGQCGGTAWSGGFSVWIDYNGNFSFNDPGEQVFSGGPSITFNVAGTVLNAPGPGITIPLTATPGNTRMRVSAQEGGIPPSCGSWTWGETEDYTVMIGGGTPCAGTPTVNTVITPTAAICPNTSANLSLVNSYTTAGITYSWVGSTASSVGPWTLSVPNGTSPSLATPNLTTTTWFSAIITCTNGNGSVQATSNSVAVQPITIDNVPYFEGFEGITSNNRLPNCSWIASNLPQTCQTYTAAQTTNRIPFEGNKFASFYYTPNLSNYFYSNGIQLNAGVTYSAGLWYTTEAQGNTNMAMRLWLGPNQSTTGAVVVASNSPAVSPIYKALGNTFTVATSGIYYLGINGISTGCCAQWMSWDALSVTIPCNLNSPNMSLNTNSLTICQGQTVNLTANGADTYTWSTGSNNALLSDAPFFNTVYTVVGTNTLSGCTATLSQAVQVNPSPVVSAISPQATICAGSNANLLAFGASTYTWSNPSNSTGPNILVTPAASTNYTVIGTNAIGCSSQATVAITVNALPTLTISSSSTSGIACEEDETTLTGSGASSYQWQTSSSILLGGVVPVSPNTTTTYTLFGTNAAGCSNTTTYVLNVTNCVGLKNVTTTKTGISLYPNPSNGVFTVELVNGSANTIEITDVTGRVIMSKNSSDAKMNFDLNNYSNGVYYVKVSNENSSETIKVVKQ